MALCPRRLFLYNFVMLFVPETSLFGFKRVLLRWCGAKIANDVRICSSARFFGGGELEIGEETWVGHQCLVIASAKISIGACVDMGPRAYVGTGSHEVDAVRPHSAGAGISLPIQIENGCWLGANTVVLPDLTIGEKAVVAAGAVVTRHVEPLTLVGGVPAKLIKALKIT
jgi:acetyltransferase-like isoleucine patch superfamily enzyme